MIRLPWRKRPDPTPTEAERAYLTAVIDLATSERRGVEVRRVASALESWRERNHVVAQLDQLFYGGRS